MDHYRFWNERYGMSLAAGGVGENFTLENIREDEICAGDILRVGGAVFQVSGPRTPCANQARRVGRTDWVKLVIRENRTGFYMRVLEAGDVQPGDAWVLIERPNPEGPDHGAQPLHVPGVRRGVCPAHPGDEGPGGLVERPR